MPGSPLTVPRPLRIVTGSMALVGGVTLTAGCGALDIDPSREVRADVTVASPVIVAGEPMPERFTCEGEGVSPPLQWSGFPAETESVAVVLDAPLADGGPKVQWVAFGLDPQEGELTAGAPGAAAEQAANSSGEVGYDPPCPEADDGGTYRFTVYALSEDPGLSEGAELAEATEAIADRVLGYGRLQATA